MTHKTLKETILKCTSRKHRNRYKSYRKLYHLILSDSRKRRKFICDIYWRAPYSISLKTLKDIKLHGDFDEVNNGLFALDVIIEMDKGISKEAGYYERYDLKVRSRKEFIEKILGQ